MTPPLDVHASGYSVHVAVEKESGGFLPQKVTLYLQARVCASCGLSMMFARPDGLRELQARWASLKWPTP